MDEKTVEKLSKVLKGEKGSYRDKIVSEIYSEVNQINQKQDQILEVLKEWQQKQN